MFGEESIEFGFESLALLAGVALIWREEGVEVFDIV